jgi:hypothetical protein
MSHRELKSCPVIILEIMAQALAYLIIVASANNFMKTPSLFNFVGLFFGSSVLPIIYNTPKNNITLSNHIKIVAWIYGTMLSMYGLVVVDMISPEIKAYIGI